MGGDGKDFGVEQLKAMIEAARDRADALEARTAGIFLDRARHAVDGDESPLGSNRIENEPDQER